MSKQSESKRTNLKCKNDISGILGHLKVKLTCTDCIAIITIVLFLCYAICSTLEIMHKFINTNYDIIGQNVGQIQQTSGTKTETTVKSAPVVNMLKYDLT